MRIRGTRGGLIKINLDENERQLLRDLADQLAELIGQSGLLPGSGSAAESELVIEPHSLVELEATGETFAHAQPQNSIIDKFFPDAYPDDSEASREFRRFTGPELARLKAKDATTLAQAMSESTTLLLDEQQLQPWLRSITDVRVALAMRLGIEQDGDEGSGAPEDAAIQAAYWWLGELQERLVRALFH